MKIIGIVLNLIGLFSTIGLFIVHFFDIGPIAIVGGDDGPTTIFLTAKWSNSALTVVLFFFIVFAFNLYSFVKTNRYSRK